jgi:hypothetical protein
MSTHWFTTMFSFTSQNVYKGNAAFNITAPRTAATRQSTTASTALAERHARILRQPRVRREPDARGEAWDAQGQLAMDIFDFDSSSATG